MRKSDEGLWIAEYHDLFDYDKFPENFSDGRSYREAYGQKFFGNPSDLQIEMHCARNRLTIEDGGLGEAGHYKEIFQMLFPYMKSEWNHWNDRFLDCMLGYGKTNVILGGSGLGKSWMLGTFAAIWQACWPKGRQVTIVNTTQKTQNKRAFKWTSKTYRYFAWLAGEVSQDKKNPAVHIYENVKQKNGRYKKTLVDGVGINTMTIKRGNSAQATADAKGDHAPENLMIIEEANHSNQAHLERVRSNFIGNHHYLMVLVGNPAIEDQMDVDRTANDALYYFSTPIYGYESITWGEDSVWQTKLIEGLCYHFDVFDSPKLKDKDPDRFVVSTWLPDQAYIDKKARELKGQDSLLFKQQVRGIYDHSMLPDNPISKGVCDKFLVGKSAAFIGQARQRWGAYDPSQGKETSDEAFLKIAESAREGSGSFKLDFLGERSNFVFKVDTESAELPAFQQLEWIKEKTRVWQVPFENLVVDTNIIGDALGDIFKKFLSPKIVSARISGQPTDFKIGDDKASDRCKNIKTEQFLGLQHMILSNQIRGLDQSILEELYIWPMKPGDFGDKVCVLGKTDFKKLFNFSPNRAEAALWLADIVRRRGFESYETKELGLPEATGVERSMGNPFRDASGYGGQGQGQAIIKDLSGRPGAISLHMPRQPWTEPEKSDRDKQIENLRDAYRNFEVEQGRG